MLWDTQEVLKEQTCASPCGRSRELRAQTKMFGCAAPRARRAEAVHAEEEEEETLQHAEDDEMGVGSCPLPLRHREEEMDVT